MLPKNREKKPFFSVTGVEGVPAGAAARAGMGEAGTTDSALLGAEAALGRDCALRACSSRWRTRCGEGERASGRRKRGLRAKEGCNRAQKERDEMLITHPYYSAAIHLAVIRYPLNLPIEDDLDHIVCRP